jgi:hypothetical protein
MPWKECSVMDERMQFVGKAGRKKKEGKGKEKGQTDRWYPNSRARPPRSGDCD